MKNTHTRSPRALAATAMTCKRSSEFHSEHQRPESSVNMAGWEQSRGAGRPPAGPNPNPEGLENRQHFRPDHSDERPRLQPHLQHCGGGGLIPRR